MHLISKIFWFLVIAIMPILFSCNPKKIQLMGGYYIFPDDPSCNCATIGFNLPDTYFYHMLVQNIVQMNGNQDTVLIKTSDKENEYMYYLMILDTLTEDPLYPNQMKADEYRYYLNHFQADYVYSF